MKMKIISSILVLLALGWFAIESYSIVRVGDVNNQQVSELSKDGSIELRPGTTTAFSVPAKNVSDNGEGEVTLSASIKKLGADNLILEVDLNTHSVDLDEVSFEKNIFVEKDGQKYPAVESKEGGSGHHINSTMTFASLKFPFTLVGQDIGGIPERRLEFAK